MPLFAGQVVGLGDADRVPLVPESERVAHAAGLGGVHVQHLEELLFPPDGGARMLGREARFFRARAPALVVPREEDQPASRQSLQPVGSEGTRQL